MNYYSERLAFQDSVLAWAEWRVLHKARGYERMLALLVIMVELDG